MRIAVFTNRRFREYICNVFGNHPELEAEIVCFPVFSENTEKEYNGIPVISFSEIESICFDIALVAFDNEYLLRELRKSLCRSQREYEVFILKPFIVEKQVDFAASNFLDAFCADKFSKDEAVNYNLCRERRICEYKNVDRKAGKYEKKLINLSKFEDDVQKWKNSGWLMGKLVLKGEEPLREPERCVEIIKIFRKYFPHTEIRIRTGGKYIGDLDKCFWTFLKENHVIVEKIDHIDFEETIDELETILVREEISYLKYTWSEVENKAEEEHKYRQAIIQEQGVIIQEQRSVIRQKEGDERKIRKQKEKCEQRNKWIMRLRDTFYAGYSLPQYCADNGYKKPLILGKDENFMWELHTQFTFDKRFRPKFGMLGKREMWLKYSEQYVYASELFLADEEKQNEESYDVIFVFDIERKDDIRPKEKTIYLDELVSDIQNYVYNVRPLLEYRKRHPGVKVVVMNHPLYNSADVNTEGGWVSTNRTVEQLYGELKKGNQEVSYAPFDELGYSREETIQLLKRPDEILREDGSSYLLDDMASLVSIFGGCRKTSNQEEQEYEHTIWCVGICQMYGYCAPYDKTIESYLQGMLNEAGDSYRVINAGGFLTGRSQDMFYNLEKLHVRSGDLVIAMLPHVSRMNGIPYLNIQDLFYASLDVNKMFADKSHLNERGYEKIAGVLYHFLKENVFFDEYLYQKSNAVPVHQYGIPKWVEGKECPEEKEEAIPTELSKYKSMLAQKVPKIGAIVANCNPFTYGHRFLIEYAASRCDRLYVFVVEEDRSFFPFADRLKMVQQGVVGLRNVTVIPSGKYIASYETFYDYFNKVEKQEGKIDVTLDLETFAKEIAPVLGINVRFAGEEPIDNITRQYNEGMSKILPKYGIEFHEVPRKVDGNGNIVSAKHVRRYLQEKNFDEIKKIVPISTYEYLVKYYK